MAGGWGDGGAGGLVVGKEYLIAEQEWGRKRYKMSYRKIKQVKSFPQATLTSVKLNTKHICDYVVHMISLLFLLCLFINSDRCGKICLLI